MMGSDSDTESEEEFEMFRVDALLRLKQYDIYYSNELKISDL